MLELFWGQTKALSGQIGSDLSSYLGWILRDYVKEVKMPEKIVINEVFLVIEKSKVLTIEHSKVKKVIEKGSDLNSFSHFLKQAWTDNGIFDDNGKYYRNVLLTFKSLS